MPIGVYVRTKPRTKPVWNKGLTKETDERVAKQARTATGKPHPMRPYERPNNGYKKGHIPWNTGLTRETDSRVDKVIQNLIDYRHINGWNVTEETRNKLRLSNKGRAPWDKGLKGDPRVHNAILSCWIKRKENGNGTTWLKGLTKETDKRLSNMGIYPRTEEQKKNCAKNFGSVVGEKNGFYGKHHTVESLRKIFRYHRPTKPEVELLNILESLYPGEYYYTGDGSLVINGKNPDFASKVGKRELLEMFGDYWHKEENPQDRINIFAKVDYKCLVIWEHELDDKSSLANRIQSWRGGGIE